MSEHTGSFATDIARAGHPARATVWAGAVDTTYVRAGCGRPVLLLCDAEDASSHPLLLALASRCRVIAPSIPREAFVASAFDAWATDFLDGLGLVSVSIVADGPLWARALAFARAEPARVDRLALIARDGEDRSPRDRSTVAKTAAEAHSLAIPTLVSASAEDVVIFLAAER